ncbi:24872_t:CDS:2, partial [Gigaspora rosea]
MNQLIKKGIRSTSSLHNLNEHIQHLLDNEAKWAQHNNYLASLPTNQTPSVVDSIFPNVLEVLKAYLTPHILAVQQQQINGSLLYRAQLWPRNNIYELQENFQLDFDASFLEDQLDRPQIFVIGLIRNIDPDDIVEIWELVCLSIRQWIWQNEESSKCCLGSWIESISLDQPNQIIVMDPLVTKHHGRPTTKRLKSSFESQSYKASTHSYHTINPQDSNLRIPLAPLVNNDSNDGHALAPLVNNDSNGGHALNNNIEKP